MMADDDQSLGSLNGFTMTNARGEFRLESVAPGKFQARANSMGVMEGTTDYYADPVNFEVRAANVENLEIQVHRGASISGVVVVENPRALKLAKKSASSFSTSRSRTFKPNRSPRMPVELRPTAVSGLADLSQAKRESMEIHMARRGYRCYG